MGKLLCRIGMHRWKLTNGAGYSTPGSKMFIVCDKDCVRCGKHTTGSFLV